MLRLPGRGFCERVKNSVANPNSFQIFDLNGRPLEALAIKPNGALYRLDVSNLAAGTYFLRDSYGRTKRFVKVN